MRETLKRFAEAWTHCQPWRDQCRSSYKSFFGYNEDYFLGFQFPVVEHLCLKLVEQQTASLVPPAMSGRTIIEVLPGTKDRTVWAEVAKQCSHVLNQVISDSLMHNPEEFESFVKGAAIQGLSHISNTPFYDWDNDYQNFTYRGCEWKYVSPFSFCFLGDAAYPEDEEYLYFCENLSLQQFHRRAQKNKDFMNVPAILESARMGRRGDNDRGIEDEIATYKNELAGILKEDTSIASVFGLEERYPPLPVLSHFHR